MNIFIPMNMISIDFLKFWQFLKNIYQEAENLKTFFFLLISRPQGTKHRMHICMCTTHTWRHTHFFYCWLSQLLLVAARAAGNDAAMQRCHSGFIRSHSTIMKDCNWLTLLTCLRNLDTVNVNHWRIEEMNQSTGAHTSVEIWHLREFTDFWG